MWLMCSTPASRKPLMFSSTLTPPSTSVSVAVPDTPEPRLGVSWRVTPCDSWARPPPPRSTDANSATPKTTPASRFFRYTVSPFDTFAFRTPHRDLREHGQLQGADFLHASYRLVVSTQPFVGFLQEPVGLCEVTVIGVQFGFGGSGGVGNHLVGQPGSHVQLTNGGTERLVLIRILWRRIKVVDLICKLSESGLIGPQILEVIGGEDVVAHELVVASQGYLYGVALYFANLTNVVSLFWLGSTLLLLGLARCFSSW